MKNLKQLLAGALAGACVLLSACGGGGSDSAAASAATEATPVASTNATVLSPSYVFSRSFTIGGSVTGLATGTSVTLLNNGADALSLNANGQFTFNNAVRGSYAVTVQTQPVGQVCTVSNASGTALKGKINDVLVTCSNASYKIGGNLSGLASGASLVLRNNGADQLTLSANGVFSFATPVARNGSYAVTVDRQPVGQTCTVGNGSGAGVTAAVSNITVTCSALSYTVGGSISGLSGQVTLRNNGGNDLTLLSNGTFTFSAPVAFNSSYMVTVATQPDGQTCSVGNGSGSGVMANVSTVTVTCSSTTLTIGGSLSGLAADTQLTLFNNGSDPLTLNANGSFQFAVPVVFNGSYAVTVGTQPLGMNCTVTNGTGAHVVANVSTVAVSCTAVAVRAQFAYVANFHSNTVSQFAIGADGSLTPLAVPSVAAGTSPYQVVSGNGAVYVVNQGATGSNGTVSQYHISASGALVPLSPASVSTGGAAASAMAISPNGLYAYVGNQQGQSIAQFTIGAGGQLTPMATPTVAAGGPLAMVVDPSGSYLYATGGRVTGSLLNKGVEVFAIGSTGALTRVATSGALGLFSNGLALTPNGKNLYATNLAESTLSQFAVNSTGGLLTALSPATLTNLSSPLGVVVDPTGSYVYATNNVGTPTQIVQYTIGSGGTLTALPAFVLTPSLDGLRGMAFDRTGQFLYLTSGSSPTGYVLQFRVGAGGGLVKVGANVAAGDAAYSITTAYNLAAP